LIQISNAVTRAAGDRDRFPTVYLLMSPGRGSNVSLCFNYAGWWQCRARRNLPRRIFFFLFATSTLLYFSCIPPCSSSSIALASLKPLKKCCNVPSFILCSNAHRRPVAPPFQVQPAVPLQRHMNGGACANTCCCDSCTSWILAGKASFGARYQVVSSW
jgi:hypothetical protein